MSIVLLTAKYQDCSLGMDWFSTYRILENTLREKGNLSRDAKEALFHIPQVCLEYQVNHAIHGILTIVINNKPCEECV